MAEWQCQDKDHITRLPGQCSSHHATEVAFSEGWGERHQQRPVMGTHVPLGSRSCCEANVWEANFDGSHRRQVWEA